MTTFLSELPAAVDGGNGLVMRLLFDDDDDVVVNEMDADADRSGQTDADGDIDGFSSFDDAFSTSDFKTATTDDSLMLLVVSPTTGMLAGSTGRLFFELLGCSASPWDEDDNADLPQAVGEIIERIVIAFQFTKGHTRQH